MNFPEIAVTHLDCRTFGHSWTRILSLPENGEWKVGLRCNKCSTLRTETLTAIGEVKRRKYTYPNGYLQPTSWKREGRVVQKKDYRIELFYRVFKSRTEMELG